MIALYSRVSTQEQVNGYSIDEQIDRMKSYCNAMGWKAIKLYTDAGVSGASIDRPSLQTLISDIHSGKIDKVLVYKLDRLSRSQKDTLELIEDVFLANGVDFISMSENFDTATPFGKAMIGILAVFAQLEREQIKERMSMGRQGRAKQGKWRGGGNVPVGYEYVNGELIINEFEAMQIRELFDLYLQGCTVGRIERIFRQKGYVHKYGQWTHARVKTVLSNNLYTGIVKCAGTSHKGIHEAIITPEQFDKAQAIKKAHSGDFKARGKNSTYLGGLIFCKQCGARFTIIHTRGKKYYECHSRRKQNLSMVKDPDCMNKVYRMEDLDQLIFGEIKKLSLDEIDETIVSPEEDRKELITAEIAKIEAKRNRFLDLYGIGSFSVEELQERILPLNDQIKKLEQELQSEPTLSDESQEMITSFSDILERGNFDEIRLVIETLIDRIEIDGEDIYIHWSFM